MTAVALVACSLLAVALATVRMVRGPRHADRIVALDVLFAAGLTLCVAAALATGRTEFLDIGIAVALVGFVATIGWTRLIRQGSAAGAAGPEKIDR